MLNKDLYGNGKQNGEGWKGDGFCQLTLSLPQNKMIHAKLDAAWSLICCVSKTTMSFYFYLIVKYFF